MPMTAHGVSAKQWPRVQAKGVWKRWVKASRPKWHLLHNDVQNQGGRVVQASERASEQFDIAHFRPGGCFARGPASLSQQHQLDPPADRPQPDSTRLRAAQIAVQQWDSFIAEKASCGLGISLPDVRQTGQHPGATEQLCAQPAAHGTAAQQPVNQQFKGGGGIAVVASSRPAVGQQKMIQPADAAVGVQNAGGNARPEDRRNDRIRIIRNGMFALNNVNDL